MNNNRYLVAVHELLVEHFNEAELKELCFKLGFSYEDLGGDNRRGKAREMVTFLDRRDRLSELKPLVQKERPRAGWPSLSMPAETPIEPPASPVRLQLSQPDFDRLVGLLAAMPEFRTAIGRVDFLEDVFAGSPRKDDVLGLINFDGNARGVAVRVITRLTQFGQAESGKETLGVLINKLLSYIGGGADADFLRGLFDRYPLTGVAASARGVADWRGRERSNDVQEKIIGENTLRDVRLLELALEASRGVVRIVSDSGMGSGFLVGQGLIMTNNHVIGSQGAAQQSRYEFNYQLDKTLKPTPVMVARAVADGLFYTNQELDITVVEVENLPPSIVPLTLSRLRMKRDDRVNIIQHPGGHYKKISMQNNFVAFANMRDIQYLTSTEPGSSGSPVLNNDFMVIGIHHSGGHLLEPGTEYRYLRNAGSSMTAVLDDLQTNAAAIYERLKLS